MNGEFEKITSVIRIWRGWMRYCASSWLTYCFNNIWNFWVYMLMCMAILFAWQDSAIAKDRPVIIYESEGGIMFLGLFNVVVEVFSSGRVHYLGGGEGVYTQGHRYSQINKKQLHALVKAFDDYKFFDLNNSYISGFGDSDSSPPERITINSNGRKKSVVFNYRNEKALKILPDLILKTVDFKRWVCFPPSYRKHDRCHVWY
ncbi:hypothetical protein SAMN02949497_4352 [Methylomagnum ishizawai]|uniref:DUF6438 domain-containing protein n=1 Tax=Methylomagnum ishizawai TaxID=1760988 RepID=A0A1Y6D1X1_9GAMM|nr:DUF6438 domain-containing protein [Methylomagnum ishizawai]SMF96938.1 hypothetical protein SAMN02949497_4352 [Methylomagnum ishizawai]